MPRCVWIGAAAIVLTLGAAGTPVAAPASSAQIAYIGKDALFLANSDGSGRQLIVRGVADHTTFSWSPDGQRLAFSGGHERQDEIFVVNADGSGLTQLTHTPTGRKRTAYDWSENPSWSPDGTRIAYDGARSETDGIPQIYVMNADGTGVRRLTQSQRFKWLPTWSPEGRGITYEQQLGHWADVSSTEQRWVPDGRIDLFTMRPDGSGKRAIVRVRNERDLCACAVWSPDGTKLAYEAAGVGGKPDIFVMNGDGTGQTQLTHNPARDENPDWSPDGTQIAFYSERVGNAEIYVMNADGTAQTRITHDAWYDQAVRWRPTA